MVLSTLLELLDVILGAPQELSDEVIKHGPVVKEVLR